MTNVGMIACGSNSSMAGTIKQTGFLTLVHEGLLYSFGWNEHGNLGTKRLNRKRVMCEGLGDVQNRNVPTRVGFFESTIEAIVAAGASSFVQIMAQFSENPPIST